MARKTEEGLTGVMGKYALYTMDGKQYVRARPIREKRKKNEPVPKINSDFGLVSRYGTWLIKAMKKYFLFKFGRDTYNASRGWMRNEFSAYGDAPEWQLAAKNNSTCQLNPASDLRDILDANFTLRDDGGGMITMGIPAINPKRQIKTPARTTKINVKVVATTAFFGVVPPGALRTRCIEQFEFNYDDDYTEPKEIKLNTEQEDEKTAGNIAIVVLALEFVTTKGDEVSYNKEQKWLPAAIIGIGRMRD